MLGPTWLRYTHVQEVLSGGFWAGRLRRAGLSEGRLWIRFFVMTFRQMGFLGAADWEPPIGCHWVVEIVPGGLSKKLGTGSFCETVGIRGLGRRVKASFGLWYIPPY